MKSMLKRWMAQCRIGLAWMAALLLVACGGGGTVPWPGVNVRALDTEFTGRMAVAYSPYRAATYEGGLDAEFSSITVSQIRNDLQQLRDAGFGAVRVFDAKVAEKTVAAIVQAPALDMKVMMGVWIASTLTTQAATNEANAALNVAEIDRAVALAQAYPNVIKAISVGNETLVSWNTWNSQNTQNMANYLRSVRSRVDQPVTTDDNWAFFAAQRNERDAHPIFNEIDFISLHTYPFIDIKYGLWDWKQESTPAGPQRVTAMMDAALQKAKADYSAVRSHLDQFGYGRLPVIVGETGWKAVATDGEGLWASPINQKMYFERLRAWKNEATGPKTIVYFSGFDERWKTKDDGWGLFESGWNSTYSAFNAANRLARCTAQALNSSLSAASGSCADADAKYYTAPVNRGAVSSTRFTVYADQQTVAGLERVTWTSGLTGQSVPENSGDGSLAWQVTPSPAQWGWGLAWTLGTQEIDLSQFAGGYLNFKIKTQYPGNIEVGFKTGADSEFNAWDVLMVLRPGQYGYQAQGNWTSVSIPISELVKNGASSFGSNSPPASLQLGRVSNVFVLADRYAKTGKADWTNDQTPILIDDIHWSR